MNKMVEDAIQEISRNHRKIIEDWCKAYLAELYEAGVDIKPGCFTLHEQNLDNVGGSVLGKKYWFTLGIPEMQSCSECKNERMACVGMQEDEA